MYPERLLNVFLINTEEQTEVVDPHTTIVCDPPYPHPDK